MTPRAALCVHLHAPDGSAVPGVLTTDHAASSYGWPVLLIVEAGRLLDSRPHGLRDATPIGLAFTLWVEPAEEPTDEQRKILDRWRAACATCRTQLGYAEPRPPERDSADPRAPERDSAAAWSNAEVVGRIVLPDTRELRVLRTPDPENGPRILLRLAPSQSNLPEGVDLSTAAALELLRALDRALRLPALEEVAP